MSTVALARSPARSRRQPIKAPPGGFMRDPGIPFLTAEDIPDEFAMQISGDCLAPDYRDGDHLVFTKARPSAGDLAIFILKPELVPPGQLQCAVKQLAFALPHYVRFPWTENPRSDVHAIAIARQTNPPMQFSIKCDRLLAVLKFSHVQRRGAQ